MSTPPATMKMTTTAAAISKRVRLTRISSFYQWARVSARRESGLADAQARRRSAVQERGVGDPRDEPVPVRFDDDRCQREGQARPRRKHGQGRPERGDRGLEAN